MIFDVSPCRVTFSFQYPAEKLTSTIDSIINSIHAWMQSLHFQEDRMDSWKLSFNLPLHRYLSIFAHHAIYKYNINPSKFLPVHDENLMMNLLFFPLRTLVSSEMKRKRSWLFQSFLKSVGLLWSFGKYLATQRSTIDNSSENLCENFIFIVDARCRSISRSSK